MLLMIPLLRAWAVGGRERGKEREREGEGEGEGESKREGEGEGERGERRGRGRGRVPDSMICHSPVLVQHKTRLNLSRCMSHLVWTP